MEQLGNIYTPENHIKRHSAKDLTSSSTSVYLGMTLMLGSLLLIIYHSLKLVTEKRSEGI